jgi:hypothetical protein
MCDYCGCRSRPLVAELGGEHERIAGLPGELRRQLSAGAADEAVAAGARRLVEVLAAHSARDEGGLYSELDASGVDTAVMHAEHHHVDDALADAAWDRIQR